MFIASSCHCCTYCTFLCAVCEIMRSSRGGKLSVLLSTVTRDIVT